MKHSFIIGRRVIAQLKGDKRFLALSLIAPLIIIYLLKILFDIVAPAPIKLPNIPGIPSPSMPVFSSEKYILPASAFIVHFLSFVLCAILLVQERTRGTLERMIISGFSKTSIISGYTIGYFGLATLQSVLVITEAILLLILIFLSKQFSFFFLLFGCLQSYR